MTTVDEGRAAAVSVTGSDLAVSLIDLPSHEIVAVSDSLLGMLDSDRGQMIGCPIETFVAGNHLEVLSLLASGHLDGAEADRMVKGLDEATFGFGFVLRSMTDSDATEVQATDIDQVLRRLSEYLLVEQSQMPLAQLPTSTELPALSQLSSREWEVLVRHHTGASPADITLALGGDSRTIQLHFKSILDKLGVDTPDELTSLLTSE
jgi:DNA-binding CsgD family transcriptional regulator